MIYTKQTLCKSQIGKQKRTKLDAIKFPMIYTFERTDSRCLSSRSKSRDTRTATESARTWAPVCSIIQGKSMLSLLFFSRAACDLSSGGIPECKEFLSKLKKKENSSLTTSYMLARQCVSWCVLSRVFHCRERFSLS